MEKTIRRVNSYNDNRFEQEVLNQHGAFLIDGKYRCQFKVINKTTAKINCDRESDIDVAIEEFRFYSENITTYINEEGISIREFEKVEIFTVNISDIQPSQFYVNQTKIEALEKFVKTTEDVVIPLTKIDGQYISLDGHTRLYIAHQKGIKQVLGFLTEAGDYIEGFVAEAANREVFSAKDLVVLSDVNYKLKWHDFCDDYFEQQK